MTDLPASLDTVLFALAVLFFGAAANQLMQALLNITRDKLLEARLKELRETVYEIDEDEGDEEE